jgi:hypothetical protein
MSNYVERVRIPDEVYDALTAANVHKADDNGYAGFEEANRRRRYVWNSVEVYLDRDALVRIAEFISDGVPDVDPAIVKRAGERVGEAVAVLDSKINAEAERERERKVKRTEQMMVRASARARVGVERETIERAMPYGAATVVEWCDRVEGEYDAEASVMAERLAGGAVEAALRYHAGSLVGRGFLRDMAKIIRAHAAVEGRTWIDALAMAVRDADARADRLARNMAANTSLMTALIENTELAAIRDFLDHNIRWVFGVRSGTLVDFADLLAVANQAIDGE